MPPSRAKHRGWYELGQKWRAKICVDGKVLYLGAFDIESEAAEAYDREAIRSGVAEKRFLNFGKP